MVRKTNTTRPGVQFRFEPEELADLCDALLYTTIHCDDQDMRTRYGSLWTWLNDRRTRYYNLPPLFGYSTSFSDPDSVLH